MKKSQKVAKRTPAPPDDGRVMVHISLPPDVLARLDERCAALKIKRTVLFQWAADDIADGKWFPSHIRPPAT